jgi:DNA-binding MarR family transcriptional regulator
MRHISTLETIVTTTDASLEDADYAALAEFRHTIRRFLAFSEAHAARVGLTPQQHQALLAIRAAHRDQATVGHVAEQLVLKPHSATGLIDRLAAQGLITRETAQNDRRRALLRLTGKAADILAELSTAHRDEIQRLRPALSAILDQFDQR